MSDYVIVNIFMDTEILIKYNFHKILFPWFFFSTTENVKTILDHGPYIKRWLAKAGPQAKVWQTLLYSIVVPPH